MRATIHVCLATGLLALLAGCVTVDGTLNADGSGTIEMVYRTPPKTTEALEKRRFSSTYVTVESLQMKGDGNTVVKAKVADATKLSTAAAFRDVTVVPTRKDGEAVLTITLTNPNPIDLKDESKPGPKINLTLPGKVLEANNNAKVDGNRASWSFGLAEYVRRPKTELVVRYTAPAPAATPTTPSAPKK